MQREALLKKLKTEHFDLLVIGGGATGCGIALDAASRGLKVALVERDDFASGTSSRSTKLIHGGVRYLEQAVKKFDRGQFKLVKEALHERATLLRLAPHLSHPIPLVTPLYKRWEIPYYWIGLKLYDRLAGKRNLRPSRFLSKKQTIQTFPMLKSKKLRGAVLYYDGQFNDARMNLSIALTAVQQGATVLNHVSVLELKKENGKLVSALVRDEETGESFPIHAKVFVNAAGPFADKIRKMDNPLSPPLLKASSGIHIILSKNFSPPDTGLLIPETEDGRVLFLLPWLGHTLVGTTDNPAEIEENPKPKQVEIDYILRQVSRYYEQTIQHSDILAAWCGLRPLVNNPKASDTAKISRDHFIEATPSGLFTITGGKWTTYRKMSEDLVNHSIKQADLKPERSSQTEKIPLIGASQFSNDLVSLLQEKFRLDQDIAQHLVYSYGDKALEVAQLSQSGYHARLALSHPHIEAEIIYATQKEMACSAVDLLARRTRLAFLDANAAWEALPRVLALMGEKLNWTAERKLKEEKKFEDYLTELPWIKTNKTVNQALAS